LAVASIPRTYTCSEYLALERAADSKSEFVNGHIYAMAGASRQHVLISGNTHIALDSHLRDKPCEIYESDMRTKVEATGFYTYPDVVVVCGEPRFESSDGDVLLNPIVIIEVLSSSTEAYDRGDKFAQYRKLTSLKEYILIAQNRALVEQYVRQGNKWLLTEVSNLADVVVFESLGCSISLQEIYRKVEFTNPIAGDLR